MQYKSGCMLCGKERFQVEMEMAAEPLECGFHDLNKECKKTGCRFCPF